MGSIVLPTYSTPVTRVSAAFGCLLDNTRTPILEALLTLDRGGTLSCMIPGSSFSYLGAYPNSSNSDIEVTADELPLSSASLYLGNLPAFHLMDCGELPNDGTLHSAALFALPDFVEWLLYTHDANFKDEEIFDKMIPLALACVSKAQPWCRVANSKSDWKTRQKKTMKLLVPKTNLDWRHRGKTVLHIALENGLDATEAIIEALDIYDDPGRDDNYLYVDKEGIEHSPDLYLAAFVDGDLAGKQPLLACLYGKGRMRSRYFKRIMPGEGNQPVGCCGLPFEYAAKWGVSPYVENSSVRVDSMPPDLVHLFEDHAAGRPESDGSST